MEKQLADDEYKTYLFSYPFDGAQWSFELKAASADEAQARLKALGWAKMDGELVARIPVPDVRSFWQRLTRSFQSIRAASRRE